MKSNAPGQLLGFTLQYPRALYHLLRSGPGDCVCVEVLGDVATQTPEGFVTAEEDKSSVVGNPLTDKSIDLWKTFSNWIDAINSNELDINKTRFVLFTNKSGKSGIVTAFDKAKDAQAARLAINNAKAALSKIQSDHAIFAYYDSVVNKHEQIFILLIQKFELQIGIGAGYDEVKHELKCKHVAETQIEFLCDKIGGWVTRTIAECLAAKRPAIIKWEDFDHQFKVVFERSRRRELFDFALVSPPDPSEVNKQLKRSPQYIKQLEAIDATDDDILEAVTDYLRAKINLGKWIEDEIIDTDVALDFDGKLTKCWKNLAEKISITHKHLSEKERGQLLCTECKLRQETIRDMSPPNSTIEGRFHSLANKPVLGWHPKWKELFLNKQEK